VVTATPWHRVPTRWSCWAASATLDGQLVRARGVSRPDQRATRVHRRPGRRARRGDTADVRPLSLLTGLVLDRVGARTGIAVAVAVFGVAQFLRSFTVGFPDMLATTVLLAVGATAITFGLPKLVAGVFPARLLGTMSTVYFARFLRRHRRRLQRRSRDSRTAAGRVATDVSRPGGRLARVPGGLGPRRLVARAQARDALRRGQRFGVLAQVLPGRRGPGVRPSRDATARRRQGRPTSSSLTASRDGSPTILESRGLDPSLAATVATLFVVGQAAGTLVIPPASDRLGRRRPAVVGCSVAAAAGVGWLVVTERRRRGRGRASSPARPLAAFRP